MPKKYSIMHQHDTDESCSEHLRAYPGFPCYPVATLWGRLLHWLER